MLSRGGQHWTPPAAVSQTLTSSFLGWHEMNAPQTSVRTFLTIHLDAKLTIRLKET